jgi:hypothetical protein
MKEININQTYQLDLGSSPIKVKTICFKSDGVECEYVLSYKDRKEIIPYEVWELNGFDVSDYSMLWMDVDNSNKSFVIDTKGKFMEYREKVTHKKPLNSKFSVGNKVLIYDKLKTKIVDVKYVTNLKDYMYYFYDENGVLRADNEKVIQRVDECEIVGHGSLDDYYNHLLHHFNDMINNGINYDVKSEAIRLCSSHYRLENQNWEWEYGDSFNRKSWELSKENAKLTAEENIRQICVNKYDKKLIDFWISVIKEIDEFW